MSGELRGGMLVAVVSLTLWLSSSTVHAQVGMSFAESMTALNSDDRAQVEAGIQSLGLIGDKASLEALIARVRRGLPRDLLLTAIFTIGAMGTPDAGPLLFDLTSHRSAEVRARTVEIIAALQPPGGAEALMTALSDPDPQVRAVAATGLGDMGASEALDKLFLAQDRGVAEASVAIGKVVKARDVGRLLNYLGRTPLHALAPALKAILTRSDVDENARLQVVARMSELATPEVRNLLREVLANSSGSLPARLRTAIATAAQQIAD